jgi:hypothetical protein
MPNIVFAATITPSTISISLLQGQSSYHNITIDTQSETCSLNKTGVDWIYGLPLSLTGSGILSLTIQVPSTTSPGTYTETINYCNASLTTTITASSSPVSGCPSTLLISGQKIAGKTIKFDIRDSSYNRVKNSGTVIKIESTETGTSYSVECQDGACTWEIPENEKGVLMVEVIVPNCTGNIVTSEIELKMAGSLVISVPNQITYGKDFYIFVYDPTSGPIKYATVQVMGPGGSTFSGKTNEYGIVYDDPLIKKYGTDIKPNDIGKYTVFASLFGYNSATATFDLVRAKCIYECCVEGEYEAKACETGYECINNKCSKIVKPQVKIECEPSEPIVYDTLSCKLLDQSNNPISGTVQSSIELDGKKETLTFSNGYANYTLSSPGKLTISVSDTTEYSGNSYTAEVKAPEIPWTWIAVVLIIVVVVVIVIIILLRKKKKTEGPEIVLESSPAVVEKVITEK